jgi:tRNA isopentenyl-2-thiomethyl-A-37 hydroxylase MiaE
MSHSLLIQIGIALGINSMGLLGYYEELFKQLGMDMTEDIHHYLQVKDNNKTKQITKAKLPASKRKGNKVNLKS